MSEEDNGVGKQEAEYIIAALVKTREVLAEYYSSVPDKSLPHDDAKIIAASAKYTQIDPTVKFVEQDGYRFRSKIEQYREAGYAEIVVLKNQSDCWMRYSLVKELSHMIVDTEDSMIDGFNGAQDLVRKIVNTPRVSHALASDSPDLLRLSEQVTELCAEDLLFPVDMRKVYKDRLVASTDSREAHKIAQELKIPEKIIENLLGGDHLERLLGIYERFVFPRL